MGNLKFRLSNMMPNSWFYKLRDMGRTRSQSTHNSTRKKHATSTSTPQKSKPNHHPRKSYYITRDLIPNHTFHNSPTNPNTRFPDPPRKSSKQRARARTRSRTPRSSSPKLVTSSVSAGCICRFDSAWKISDSPPENSSLELCQLTLPPAEFRSDRILVTHHQSFDKMVSWSSSCKCRTNSDANDIVIDIDNKSSANKFDEVDGFYAIPDLELPPIIAKPAKFNDMVRDIKKKETTEAIKPRRRSAKFEEEKINLREHKNSNVGRLSSATSPGVRLRINSPKIRGRRIQDEKRRQPPTDKQRRSRLSDSFAMVKSSFDPQTDFRKSMVEMIVENNIRESKDLEELLACYLSLNSDEYHDLIIKVFKQIWLDLN